MSLTEAQQQALAQGAAVPVNIAGQECVVLSRKAYEQMQKLLYDDSDWTPEEMRAVMARTMRDDWNDPRMDVYDQP